VSSRETKLKVYSKTSKCAEDECQVLGISLHQKMIYTYGNQKKLVPQSPSGLLTARLPPLSLRGARLHQTCPSLSCRPQRPRCAFSRSSSTARISTLVSGLLGLEEVEEEISWKREQQLQMKESQ